MALLPHYCGDLWNQQASAIGPLQLGQVHFGQLGSWRIGDLVLFGAASARAFEGEVPAVSKTTGSFERSVRKRI